jgi:hypothetical protein
MKRALAERAKQSLQHAKDAVGVSSSSSTTANNIKESPSAAIVGNGPPVPTAGVRIPSAPPSSVPSTELSSLPSNTSTNSSHLDARPNMDASNNGVVSTGMGTSNSSAASNNGSQRPSKIPRLEKSPETTISFSNLQSHQNTANDIISSTLSPISIPKKNKFLSTAPDDLKRRFSLDSALQRPIDASPPIPDVPLAAAAVDAPPPLPPPTRTNSKRKLKEESDSDNDDGEGATSSAFYLKHQNRALATELKSLQFNVQKLEQERTVRRSHCHAALRSLQELQTVWKDLEVPLMVEPTQPRSTDATVAAAASASLPNNDGVPPSTGTGDSVEWTRALHASLTELGNVSIGTPIRDDDVSLLLEQATANIAARAKILHDHLLKLLSSQQGLPEAAAASRTDVERLHNMQHELSVVTARCTELEHQVAELAASRRDVVSRERRVRRNLYRMDAGILTPEQVVNALERREDDELEAAVQLERQQMKQSENALTAAAENHKDAAEKLAASSSTSTNVDSVPSAALDELRVKISNLERTLATAEQTIQEVRYCFCLSGLDFLCDPPLILLS